MDCRNKLVDQQERDVVVALVGNPNVGKSTIFNALTGAKQHTGNWSGKTVEIAQGEYWYKGKKYKLIDLPGTYSLHPQSEEEQVTSDYLSANEADFIVLILDATCLARNLLFALQVLQCASKAMICINLLDEAERNGIRIDLPLLQAELGVPVIGISANLSPDISRLKEKIRNIADGFAPMHSKYIDDESIVKASKKLYEDCVSGEKAPVLHWFDRVVMGKWSGAAVLFIVLFLIFWLTISGANYPSSILNRIFVCIGNWLQRVAVSWPPWISGLLLDGVYATIAKVISVMLPPMIIFFPLFTLLEDLGFLPRAAFMLDRALECCGSCGKQILTMSMGIGCNSVGVMGCRIISSKREKLLAIVTNAMMPCNGKFPALLILSSMYFSRTPILSAFVISGLVMLSIGVTLLTTKLLSSSVLKGEASCFIMELPSYRRPQIKKLLSHAVLDRVVFVVLRAIAVAAPMGALLWSLHRIQIRDMNLLYYLSSALDPFAVLLGLNGTIMLAYFLSFPANELFLPAMCLCFSSSFSLDLDSLVIEQLLLQNSFTWKNACCAMMFLVFHWPCSTTCLTIKKETGSWKWVAVAIILPTVIGIILCAVLNQFLN